MKKCRYILYSDAWMQNIRPWASYTQGLIFLDLKSDIKRLFYDIKEYYMQQYHKNTYFYLLNSKENRFIISGKMIVEYSVHDGGIETGLIMG